MDKINNILVKYAQQYGGGLPLTAKEICNAVVLWVQEEVNKVTDEHIEAIKNYITNGLGIEFNEVEHKLVISLKNDQVLNADNLFDYIKGSETVVVDIAEDGATLEVHLDSEVTAKLQRVLVKPLSNPSENSLVGVDTTGAQYLVPQSQVGGKLYRHNGEITLSDTEAPEDMNAVITFGYSVVSNQQAKYVLNGNSLPEKLIRELEYLTVVVYNYGYEIVGHAIIRNAQIVFGNHLYSLRELGSYGNLDDYISNI